MPKVDHDVGGQPASAPPSSDTQMDDLYVSGAFARDISVLSSVSMELLVGTGRNSEKQQFLAPYFEIELDGSFFVRRMDDQGGDESEDDGDGEERESYSVHLTFDNVAFTIERMARLYQKLAKKLTGLSRGELTAVPSRVQYSAETLRRASVALVSAADELQASLPDTDADPGRQTEPD